MTTINSKNNSLEGQGKKIMLVLCICSALFLMEFGSASLDSLGVFKKSSNVKIAQVCSDASSINISSISYPNSTIAASNVEMISVGNGEFRYDFNLTDSLGKYDVRGISNGCEKTFATYFDITPNGYNQTTSQSINSLGYLILMIFITIIIGLLGFSLKDSEKLWVLGILFMVLSLFLLAYDFWIGYEFHKNLTGINNGSSLPETLFAIFITMVMMGLLVSGALLIKNWKKILAWFKQMKEDAKRDEQEKDDNLWE